MKRADIVCIRLIRAAEKCSQENQLMPCLTEAFGEKEASNIFALATYCATENAPMYLYENWAHATDGAGSCAISSQHISGFLKRLGENEGGREAFWWTWANLHGRNRNLVFDISSISTYSENLVFDEFGYSRDGESLLQTNVGMIFADRPVCPLGYRTYPGSIADVFTMTNLLCLMNKEYNLEHSRLVLDRGFYSAANIASLENAGYDFIIPLLLSLVALRELLRSTERDFDDVFFYFKFNGRVMRHVARSIELAGRVYEAHIFTDFGHRADETNTLLRKLAIVEERLNGMKFETKKATALFIDSVAAGMSSMFTAKKTARHLQIDRNCKAINEYALKFGKIILLPSRAGTDRNTLLEDYCRRDEVEKFFDTLKNEMDSGRGRVHSQDNFDERLFVHKVSLIIYGEMLFRLKTNGGKMRMSFQEIVSHLKRLKQIYSEDGSSVSSERTKKQRKIFAALKSRRTADLVIKTGGFQVTEDKIYCNKDNRNYLEENGILSAFKPLVKKSLLNSASDEIWLIKKHRNIFEFRKYL